MEINLRASQSWKPEVFDAPDLELPDVVPTAMTANCHEKPRLPDFLPKKKSSTTRNQSWESAETTVGEEKFGESDPRSSFEPASTDPGWLLNTLDSWNSCNVEEEEFDDPEATLGSIARQKRKQQDKALCREHQQLRLVLNVPEDTVAKSLRPGHPQLALPKMSPEAASCGVAVSAPRKALELPKSCWMCVTWHLFTHELLGKFARISSAFAALLGDERCWRTLAEPKRPAITERLLQLMLVEEQDLWAWPLCQVRNVDLDLSCAEHSTIQHVRTLLMKKLDVEETLQQVRLRNIPMAAKPREDSYTEFDQDFIRLVNPVHPKYPAGFCTSFLITDQLGSLRQHFHNFRFEMFPSRSAAGEPLSALEVVAVRGLEGTPWLEKKQFEDLSTKAAELVEFELGQLRQLPPSQILVTDRFEDWKDRLAKAYRRMLALHG